MSGENGDDSKSLGNELGRRRFSTDENQGGHRRVSIDIAALNPSSRRYSVAPLLEQGKIQEIIAVHNLSGTVKENKVLGVEPITAEEAKVEETKDKAPLLPLDPIEGVTIGLELLLDTTHILIRQHTETEEALFGVKSVARYDIMDESFNRMYYAWETDSGGCGSSRAFNVRVADFSGRPVLVIHRPYSWCNCLMEAINCCGSYGSNVYVSLPDGNALGKLKQKYSGCTPTFGVTDEYGNDVFVVKGPPGADCCYGLNICFTEVVFRIYSVVTGDEIGIITKAWPNLYGTAQQANTEYFGVRVPKEIPPNYKALLLGAVFLIDGMYFEHDATKRNENLPGIK